MGPRNSGANGQSPNSSTTAITAENFTFVRRIIEKTLVGQPQWIQAVVLFLFVFLFFYMVIDTLQGSALLRTSILVERVQRTR